MLCAPAWQSIGSHLDPWRVLAISNPALTWAFKVHSEGFEPPTF